MSMTTINFGIFGQAQIIVDSGAPPQIDTVTANPGLTITNSNRTATRSAASGGWRSCIVDTAITSGKVYWETAINTGTAGGNMAVGALDVVSVFTNTLAPGQHSVGWHIRNDGNIRVNNAVVGSAGFSYVTGDVLQIAFDHGTQKAWFGLNGTMNGDPAAGTGEDLTCSVGDYTPGIGFWILNDQTTNQFATANLTYTPPTGFSVV